LSRCVDGEIKLFSNLNSVDREHIQAYWKKKKELGEILSNRKQRRLLDNNNDEVIDKYDERLVEYDNYG